MNNVIAFHDIATSKKKHTAVNYARIQPTAKIHALAMVAGNVYLGRRVTIDAAASIRAERERPIWIGEDVTIGNSTVVVALEIDPREFIPTEMVEVQGKSYGVHVGDRAILTSHSQIHAPARIGTNTYVGMQSLIFQATVGNNCFIEPKALVMGVEIDDGRYVPPGAVITTQVEADALPFIQPHYLLRDLDRAVAKIDPQFGTSDRTASSQESKIA